MKHFKILSTCAAFFVTYLTLSAQYLHINVGKVCHEIPASIAGEMPFSQGESVRVLNQDYLFSEIESITVDATTAVDSCPVKVIYSTDAPPFVTVSPQQWGTPQTGYFLSSNATTLATGFGGFKLNFRMSGVTQVVLESVDALPLATAQSILTFSAPQGETLRSGQDYYIATLPTDLYGGYRLSIYKDGKVAHYFGVHQKVEAGQFIEPLDLVESELEFNDPAAPFVENERPGLNAQTKNALVAYQRNPTAANQQALLEQMGIKYDKVVARKKAKLRELEREARHAALVEEMQAIVDEMVNNRDVRLQQQFLRLVDPRTDDNSNDQWLVLRGSAAKNAFVAYAPVTNAEFALFRPQHNFGKGQEQYPVVNVSYDDAVAYCDWLSANDSKHLYRLPTEEEWILAAGHMPKDVKMNADFVERGLTPVNAYAQTIGASGGIDFWGNSWEWTSTSSAPGLYIVKGGSWDSSRDAARSEYSGDSRQGTQTYANVGFRVVRTDR